MRKKAAPERPDLPAELDPAPAGLFSHDSWECVRAERVEVAAELADVDLREVVWRGGDLSGRRFTGLRCRDVRFEGCDLSGAVLDSASLTRVEFDGCRLTGAALGNAVLRDVAIDDCQADLVSLSMAQLHFVRVRRTSLREADLYDATLSDVALLDCDLTRADFRDCELTEVDLHGSRLDDLRSPLRLRGAAISPDQIITIAQSLLADLGIDVTEAPRQIS